MKTIILWLVARLQEPSSAGGLAAILLASTQVAVSPTMAIGSALAGLVAFIGKEKSK